MKILLIVTAINILLIGTCYGQGGQAFLSIGYYNNCEGSDASNYTLITTGSLTNDCLSINSGSQSYLVQCNNDNTRSVNSLQVLAESRYPAGAFTQIETLFLGTGGPLATRYIYRKVIFLIPAYLKKCSSVLGYSYVTTKSDVLLISQKLDLNIFLAPSGAYEAFKKGCTTQCKGNSYMF